MRDIRLLDRPFDPNAEIDPFARAMPEAGAIASFVGKVRPGGGDSGGVEALELSHYAPLTLPGMEALADEALRRWELMGVLVLHRVGLLHPGEPIVMVSTASAHRRAAFEACDFLMDHLKSNAWFWKREKVAGEWRWIEPRDQDHADLARWSL
jgi:molybdopterin synthase catalytic subunit